MPGHEVQCEYAPHGCVGDGCHHRDAFRPVPTQHCMFCNTDIVVGEGEPCQTDEGSRVCILEREGNSPGMRLKRLREVWGRYQDGDATLLELRVAISSRGHVPECYQVPRHPEPLN